MCILNIERDIYIYVCMYGTVWTCIVDRFTLQPCSSPCSEHALCFHNFYTGWREQGKEKDKDPFPPRNKCLLKEKFSMVRFGLARQLPEAFLSMASWC